jgi:hypothetical protein
MKNYESGLAGGNKETGGKSNKHWQEIMKGRP